MKRDCGPGELIPVQWCVVSCTGESDKETETRHVTLAFAMATYEARVLLAKDIKCSDVRLYAKDAKGYMNCMKSWMHDAKGEIRETNRMNEL